jgi:membrane-associated phospholipid phosphatase
LILTTLHHLLVPVANAVNPALAITLIVAAILDWRAGRRRALLTFGLPSVLGVAAIYLVMFLDKKFLLWQRYDADYSTHTAFATTAVISLFLWRPSWRVPLVAVWLSYLVLIIYLRYHTLADVVAAAIVAFVITVPLHLAARRIGRGRGERAG